MVASTLVVHAPRLRASPQSPVAGVHAPVQPLRPEEQVAVIAFAERAAQLTPERQEELADIAEPATGARGERSEEHTSELQSLMRISYAVFCLKKKTIIRHIHTTTATISSHKRV